MRPEDAEEYTQALGQVVAGGWRQVALGQRLGVPAALGLTTEEWVEGRLGGYVRLSIPQRREAVAELTAPEENGGQGLSNRAAADVLGVDKRTVGRDQQALEGADAPDEEDGPNASNGVGAASGASAPEPDSAELERERAARLAALPDDLAARVRNGLAVEEAETITAERERRLDAWAEEVRRVIAVAIGLAGHPIPAGLQNRLSERELQQLDALLAGVPAEETE